MHVNIDTPAVEQGEKSGSINPDNDGYLFSRKMSWWIFFLLYVLLIFDFMDRQIIASLFPFLKAEWGISDFQCGLLSAVVSWAITIFAFPVSIAADRWSRKKVVGIMSTIWSTATFVCAFTTGYFQLLASRFIVGLGEAGYGPVGSGLIATIFPQRLRARLLGLYHSGTTLGVALGTVLGGYIAHQYGWRHAFGLVALPGLVFAVLFFFVRDFKTVALTKSVIVEGGKAEKKKMTKKDILNIFRKTPSLFAIYGGTVMAHFFAAGMMTWMPSYFVRAQGMTVSQAGLRTGLILGGSIIGNIIGGWLADRFVTRGITSGRPLAAAAAQFGCFLIFPAAFIFAGGITQTILFFLGGILIVAHVAPCQSAIVEVVHPGIRSMAIAVQVVVQSVLGQALGAIFVGAVSDRYGLSTALIVASFIPGIAMACYLLASVMYKKDIAKVEKVEIAV